MSKYCNHCMALLQDNEGSCPVCGKNNAASVPAHHLLPGTILNGKFYVGEALGEGGFGYDPLFWSTELHKGMAEASMQEKNKISHRGKAIRKLVALWEKKK